MARDSSGSKNEPIYDTLGQPADAADLTEIAAYAALVGNLKVLTDAQRTALTGADRWVGMYCYTTDTFTLWQYRASGWVVVIQDSGWLALPMSNGWVSFGGAYSYAEYRKINGVVWVHGEIKSGTLTNPGGLIATLPAGFRPSGFGVYSVWNDNQPRSLEIGPAGQIVVGALAVANSRLSLVLQFPADG